MIFDISFVIEMSKRSTEVHYTVPGNTMNQTTLFCFVCCKLAKRFVSNLHGSWKLAEGLKYLTCV